MVLVVEMHTALLSIDESPRRLFDQSPLRAKVKSSQREERWDASKTARIRARRLRVVTVRVRNPKDMQHYGGRRKMSWTRQEKAWLSRYVGR